MGRRELRRELQSTWSVWTPKDGGPLTRRDMELAREEAAMHPP